MTERPDERSQSLGYPELVSEFVRGALAGNRAEGRRPEAAYSPSIGSLSERMAHLSVIPMSVPRPAFRSSTPLAKEESVLFSGIRRFVKRMEGVKPKESPDMRARQALANLDLEMFNAELRKLVVSLAQVNARASAVGGWDSWRATLSRQIYQTVIMSLALIQMVDGDAWADMEAVVGELMANLSQLRPDEEWNGS